MLRSFTKILLLGTQYGTRENPRYRFGLIHQTTSEPPEESGGARQHPAKGLGIKTTRLIGRQVCAFFLDGAVAGLKPTRVGNASVWLVVGMDGQDR